MNRYRSIVLFFSAVFVCVFLLQPIKVKAAPGDLDLSFNAGALATDVNGPIMTLARQADGKLVIAGSFTEVRGVPRNRVARLMADGTLDPNFMNGNAGPNDVVREMVIQPDGKIIIAGEFTLVDDVARTRLARLDPDGVLDSTWHASADATVRTMGLLSSGQLVIGGDFETVRGTSQYRLAVLESLDGTPAVFNNPIATPSGGVISLAVQGDDKIVVGGQYAVPGDASTARLDLMRIDANGNVDLTFARVDIGAASINSVSIQSDDKVLISGGFSTVNGTARTGIARLESNGTLDPNFFDGETGAGPNATLKLFSRSNGKILVHGSMNSFSGVSTPENFIQLNADGTVDTTFTTSDSLFLEPADALVLNAHGMLLSHEVPATGIKLASELVLRRLDSTEETFTSPIEFLPAIDNQVISIAVQNDGRVVIGGTFEDVQGTPMTGTARLNADGRRDESFGDFLVRAYDPGLNVRIQGDGNTIVFGGYSRLSGGQVNGLWRLMPDGTRDNGFNANLGAFWNGTVNDVVVQPDGKMLVGGLFNDFGGQPHKNLVRILADGSLDESFMNGLVAPNGTVTDIELQLDGKIIIAGGFTDVNGIGRNRIARLLPDGSVDTTFLNGLSGADGTVEEVVIQPDRKILVGGLFSFFNGVNRLRIVRLDENGAIDSGFMNGVAGANDSVKAIALKSDGKIVIGGNFTLVAGNARGRLAQLNENGTLDTSFMNGLSGFDSTVSDVAIDADGDVLAAGTFRKAHGTPISFIARLDGGGTGGAVLPTVVEQPVDVDTDLNESVTFAVVATGTGPLSYQWKKGDENVTDGNGVSGAATAVLVFDPTKVEDAGSYTVVVSNAKGSVTSDSVELTLPMPPIAFNDLIEREAGQSVSVLISELLANDFDPGGGAVSFVGVIPFSGQSGSANEDGEFVRYDGFFDVTDSYEYEIENSGGARAIGIVTVVVRDPTHTAAPTLTTGTMLPGNMIQFDFQGVPNKNYLIQGADNLSNPNWTTLDVLTADESGVIVYDGSGIGPEQYFRLTPVL